MYERDYTTFIIIIIEFIILENTALRVADVKELEVSNNSKGCGTLPQMYWVFLERLLMGQEDACCKDVSASKKKTKKQKQRKTGTKLNLLDIQGRGGAVIITG